MVISWYLIRRTGRTMTRRAYTVGTVALGVAIIPFSVLLPLGIMAVNHPESYSYFLRHLIVERQYYASLLVYLVVLAVIGGWAFAHAHAFDKTQETQS